MRLIKLSVLIAACAYAWPAAAGLIAFSHEGTGSGTLGGDAFGEADFVITAVADTDDVIFMPPFATFIPHLEAAITIDGVGTFDFVTPTTTFAEHLGQFGAPAVGFGPLAEVGGNPEPRGLFWGPLHGAFGGWDTITPVGPIEGTGFQVGWSGESVETTGGLLIFDDDFSLEMVATFTAEFLGPFIGVQPESLSSTLKPEQTETHVLTIANSGQGTLDWQVSEEGGSPGRVLRARGSSVPLHLGDRSPAPVSGAALSTAPLRDFGAARSYPFVAPAGGGAVTITHSSSLDIQALNSVSCSPDNGASTRATRFLRAFALADFDITSEFEVTEITFGVEELTGSAPITVNLYTLEGAFLYDNMTLIGTATESLPAQDLSLVTLPVSATAPAGSVLVVEIDAPDLTGQAAFFPGSNNQGETAFSYIAADQCGMTEPTPVANTGNPDMHLVMTVTGNGTVEPLDCTLPGWMDIDPLDGSIPEAGEQIAEVTFDAAGVAAGEYDANLCLASSDPVNPLITVPLALSVTESDPPVIDVDPDGFDIELDTGQTETHSLTVANTGGEALTWDVVEQTTAFRRVGAMTLESGEDAPISALIDPAGRYAYFNTETAPGRVVKIDLETFERVGAITLESGENQLWAAAIDPAGEYAYVGGIAFPDPGFVVKIDLETFERVDAIIFEPGENSLSSAVIDPAGEFAYFGTGTVPGQVVKVDLETFERVDVMTMEDGEDWIFTALIDPAGDYAYFGTVQTSRRVIKVDLDTFERVGAIDLETGGGKEFLSAVLDPAAEYAYFGAGTFPGQVEKIDLENFEHVETITLDNGEDFPFSATIDPAGDYVYFGTFTTPGRVVQLDLETFERVDAITLENDESAVLSALTDHAGDYAYFGTFDLPGRVVKVDVRGDCALPDWASVDPDGGTVPGGDQQVVEITFDASGLEPGEFEAVLCLASNDPATPLAVVPLSLTVTSAAAPELVFEPSSLDFDDVVVGTVSPPRMATLRNTGDADATGLVFSTPGNGFEVVATDCGDELPAGDSCEVSVTLSPGEPGPVAAILEVSSDQDVSAGFNVHPDSYTAIMVDDFDIGGLQEFKINNGPSVTSKTFSYPNVQGTGTAQLSESGMSAEIEITGTNLGVASMTSNAVITVDATTQVLAEWDFTDFSPSWSNAVIGMTDWTNEVTLLYEGPVAPDSRLSGSEMLTLEPGVDYQVLIIADSAAPSLMGGSIAVVPSQGANVLELTGNGVLQGPPGELEIEPAKLVFDQVIIGSSAVATATVTHDAGPDAADLVLAGIDLTGNPAFTVTGGDCAQNMPLAPQENCTVEISFTPAEVGVAAGVLQVASADGQLEVVGLAGAGVDESEPPEDVIFGDRFEQ